jgi:hypothetical protein
LAGSARSRNPANFCVTHSADSRTVTLSWNAVPDAVGYHIRFGLAPQKRDHDYIFYNYIFIDITSLLARHDYWFAIDSLNEGGITNGSAIALFNQATDGLPMSLYLSQNYTESTPNDGFLE